MERYQYTYNTESGEDSTMFGKLSKCVLNFSLSKYQVESQESERKGPH